MFQGGLPGECSKLFEGPLGLLGAVLDRLEITVELGTSGLVHMIVRGLAPIFVNRVPEAAADAPRP